jgi:aryl-alcohol dehydrogenase (NADP+)
MVVLGQSDLDVFPLCLGANPFGWTASKKVSFKILDEFVDMGGNFLDTADVYSAWAPGNSGGESETIIGGWLASRGMRERIVVATKVSRHPAFSGLSAANVSAAAEASLRRLKVERLDIYYAHYDDPGAPLPETIGAFAGLVQRGLVGGVGLSNYSAERVEEWLETASEIGAPPPVVIQPHYNLLVRKEFEAGLRTLAAKHHLGVVPYLGLAAGFLTGKYRSAADASGAAREAMVGDYLTEGGFAVVRELEAVAGEHEVAPATIALAWLRAQPGVTAPIASASHPDQVRALMSSATLTLTAEQLARLEHASAAFGT